MLGMAVRVDDSGDADFWELVGRGQWERETVLSFLVRVRDEQLFADTDPQG
jgi:hypothetical protein